MQLLIHSFSCLCSVSPLEPAGSIMSNAADMAKWMRFNLNNGTTQNGKPMFNTDSFLQIFEASFPSLLFCYKSQSEKL